MRNNEKLLMSIETIIKENILSKKELKMTPEQLEKKELKKIENEVKKEKNKRERESEKENDLEDSAIGITPSLLQNLTKRLVGKNSLLKNRDKSDK